MRTHLQLGQRRVGVLRQHVVRKDGTRAPLQRKPAVVVDQLDTG
jgi:hypothetical protein